MPVSWFTVYLGLGLAYVAAVNPPTKAGSVDYAKVPITEAALYTPPLEEIVHVLSSGLKSYFEWVSVSAEDSPDLTEEPFWLTSPGLTGRTTLVDVGGQAYLQPWPQKDKVYDLESLLRYLRRDPALLIGATVGLAEFLGANSEISINLSVRKGCLKQGSCAVSVQPVGAAKGNSGYLARYLPRNETRTALLGHYLLSDGRPGKVIKVVAKKRIGDANFATAIRETLEKYYYGDKTIGLGGAFLLRTGNVINHVMPEFPKEPLCTRADLKKWQHTFEMRAPVTYVGTLLTGDLGQDFRNEHFHAMSAHGDAGHYEIDSSPDIAEYQGYFTLASSAVRVDQPRIDSRLQSYC